MKVKYDRFVFHNIDNEEKAYWLGFIYADGNVHANKVAITLGAKDKDHLEKFANFLKYEGTLYHIKNKTGFAPIGNTYYRLAVSSKQMISDLANYGVTPNKTFNISFPILPVYLYKHFIRGFFDGDGCFTLCNNCESIYILGVEKFLLDILSWAGITQKLLTRKDKNKQLKVLQLYGQRARDFHQLLYADSSIYMERKKFRWEYPNRVTKKINSRQPKSSIVESKVNVHEVFIDKCLIDSEVFIDDFSWLQGN